MGSINKIVELVDRNSLAPNGKPQQQLWFVFLSGW